VGQDLSEDLLADFEVSLAVKILEEALSVEPVSTDYFFEGFDATLDGFAVFSRWFLARIDGLGPNVFYFDIQVLLQVLFSEYLINSINKVSPADMVALLRRFEFSS
jgi:hypothetical protein